MSLRRITWRLRRLSTRRSVSYHTLKVVTRSRLSIPDAKDLEVHKHQRMLEALEDANKDREETITQFRDLVMNLQQWVSSTSS
jgi:hypothetical protein